MPAADAFASNNKGLSTPATDIALLTGDDANDLARVPRALLITTTGTLKVMTLDGTTIVIPSIAAPFVLSLRITRLFATNTTATVYGLF